MKYEVEFFDVKKGTPSATVAGYGFTLNTGATELIGQAQWARVGLDRVRKLIVLEPLPDGSKEGAFALRVRGGNTPYVRVSSRDFMRVVSMATGVSLDPPLRCVVARDSEAGCLVIDLTKILDTVSRKRNSQAAKKQVTAS